MSIVAVEDGGEEGVPSLVATAMASSCLMGIVLAVYAENMSRDTKRKFCFVNIGFNELDGMQQLRSMKGTIKPMGITGSDHERNYSSCDEGHTTYEGLKNHRQLT